MTQEQNFKTLFEDYAKQRNLEEGSDLLAEVKEINDNYVVVNAGLKSEAHIPLEEFYDDNQQLEVKVGDEIEVEIELLENGRGEAMLSRRNTRRKQAWRRVEEAVSNDSVMEGTVYGRVKGGYAVSLDGLRAFLPGSLVDVFPHADPTTIVGQRMDFRLIKVNPERNSLVVSRRAVIERDMLEAKDSDFVENLSVGQKFQGKVRAILEYGAFIEIAPGIFGLLHITDISWKHTSSVSDVLSKEDEVEVMVLGVDKERRRVSLGMKQLQPNPWEYFHRTHPINSRVFGKVTCVLDYGIFVEVEEGVQGLVHSSEMSWTRKSLNPVKLYVVGQEVEVMILAIDVERRRISMGIKQCHANPWQEFAVAYRKGGRVSGKVRSISEFGLFVELPGGIDGLVRLSELSYDKPGEDAIRDYRKGQEVEAVILSLEPDRERIGLGIKQIQDEGFESFSQLHLKGAVVSGTITAVLEKGAQVRLDGGVRGFLPIGEISEQRIDDINEHIKEGETHEFVLLNNDSRNMQAVLSIKERDRQHREQALNERKKQSPAVRNTLGAMLQAKIKESESALGADSDSAAVADSSAKTSADSAADSSAKTAAQDEGAAEVNVGGDVVTTDKAEAEVQGEVKGEVKAEVKAKAESKTDAKSVKDAAASTKAASKPAAKPAAKAAAKPATKAAAKPAAKAATAKADAKPAAKKAAKGAAKA